MASAFWHITHITQEIAGIIFDVTVVDANRVYETEISVSQYKVQLHSLDNADGEVIPSKGILLW